MMSFKRNIETEIVINATTKKVYSILTELETYSEWSPFIKLISGNLKPGEKLNVFIQPEGERGMIFKPTVLNVEENREIRWIGNLGINGIFDGEHYFTLVRITDEKVKLIHGENFSGALVPFLWGMIKISTAKGFIAHNNALKKRAEA